MMPVERDGLIIRVENFNSHTVPTWMIHDHFREVAQVMRGVVDTPNPDFGEYLRLQEAGKTLFVAVRESKALNLVGYVGLVIKEHPHYKDVLVATDDAYYLMPAYRGRGTGEEMLRYAEAAAVERGAIVFLMRTKSKHNTGHIYERMGYELEDLVYKKDLRHAVVKPRQ